MAVYNIDVAGIDTAYETISVVLEAQSYEMTFQYNPRDESWYLYFGLPNLAPIFKTKITNGTDILRKYRAYEDVPKGSLFITDLQKVNGRMDRDGFSSGRFSLTYVDESSRLLIQEL
ncbi:hypothetical protein Barba22A_gp111 [Rheinheimera phage vB_RspM_Barba22A]|jgi:hypothetical protein|uniref:Cyanophage baseplate Pam3 plug gp18 domain-containing protein n=85 Tax=Barbavirus TaxID=2733095 RepID=A0A7G9VS00_9CAUD|nr:hypothetical protein HOV44_gp119 [Rheinheimera phage Barba5S]YP_009822851.1 hypothetical protein HOV45_gp115 [Rheinheimera phage Barba8S]YP_009822988.1 hypothetical protein HOV46_gp111 [Rheinheimera phage vB_RspM_Barba18A]YP_009823132.1 hypothetical protein HOV47_gp119 [Rheinheimera phage vB_RspM_Barba19A]YP_009823270.1 hypothetical protein HOV48_gp114 [Rheinheimera phage Barba21A]QCQ57962.1 hypothetical protein Barba1A_gp111 [Rheinheimera phage vB_RspM_Barba1A]QCQ58098.1 hypothetical prot